MEKERLRKTRSAKITHFPHSVFLFKIYKLLQKTILQLSFIESYHKINPKVSFGLFVELSVQTLESKNYLLTPILENHDNIWEWRAYSHINQFIC